MRLAIDLDESLINTVEGMLIFNNHIVAGIPFSKEQITNYHMEQIPELKAQGFTTQQAVELFDTFLLEGPIDLITPIDGASEALERLKKQGAELIILTARHTGLQSKTEDTVTKLFPNLIDDIIFANHYTKNAKGKGVICRENGLDMMVEDNLSYSQELVSKGVPVHLIEQPWNRIYDNSYKVYGVHHHPNRAAIYNAIIGK